jgi:small-conductance mechanosensitive channel
MGDLLAEDWFLWGVVLVVGFQLGVLALGEMGYRQRRQGRPSAEIFSIVRNLVLPVFVLLLFLEHVLGFEADSAWLRIVETLLWVSLIHAALATVNALVFEGAEAESWRARVPKLFLDLTRFFMVIIGGAIVLSAVWGRDLGGFLAALGVGSIVLGFALQDTLGNLMSGIALLFERPFTTGEWIKVGGRQGLVVEMNWRSVRIRTRQKDLLVVPNSILGREIITNTARPTKEHAELIKVAFSLEDPPNKVKQVLLDAAFATPGVPARPSTKVRVHEYEEDRIQYEVKLYVDELPEIPSIRDEFLTRVWYAAQRAGLTIPVPRRRFIDAEAREESRRRAVGAAVEALSRGRLFAAMDSASFDDMTGDLQLLWYTGGEHVVAQGGLCDALYVIRQGRARVTVRDAAGELHEVLELGPGDAFGEGSLLSGAPSDVSVTACEDLEVARIGSPAVDRALEHSVSLARELSDLIEARRNALSRVHLAA